MSIPTYGALTKEARLKAARVLIVVEEENNAIRFEIENGSVIFEFLGPSTSAHRVECNVGDTYTLTMRRPGEL